jgi:hypothetical protein
MAHRLLSMEITKKPRFFSGARFFCQEVQWRDPRSLHVPNRNQGTLNNRLMSMSQSHYSIRSSSGTFNINTLSQYTTGFTGAGG